MICLELILKKIKNEIESIIGLDTSKAISCSAKTGVGIPEILQAVVDRIPSPKDNVDHATKALIFDSYYDPYRGVIVYFRIMSGGISTKDKILLMASKKSYDLDEIGVMAPDQVKVNELHAGEVGYLAASIKAVADARVGDTITLQDSPAEEALPGYTEAKPMVFCGLFPTDADQYPDLREALDKLQLSDAALKYEPETSSAMGFGFRCGFLGLLHMEIVQERLEREYDLDLIVTAPSVIYKVKMIDGEVLMIDNPATLPDPQQRETIEEPYVRMEIYAPNDYNGTLMGLCQDRRGDFVDMKYITTDRVTLIYEIPLAEVVTDFFDQMKSRTKGYASMEYHLIGYRKNELVRLDVLINSERADPLTTIVHKDSAYAVGKGLVGKLKELIPKQQFKIPLQASIGSRVIASEGISALRKDVLSKCYGGDISRKKKLLKKQAKGKKRMKSMGKVDVPQEAFMAVLKLNND